jgi:amidase
MMSTCLQSQLYTADGGKDITSDLEISGEPRIGWLLKGDEPHLSTYDYWQLCRKKNEYLKSTLDALEGTVKLTSTGRPLDGVISPVSAHAAEKHGKEQ